MKSFLNIVAQDILAKYGTNLSEVVVVFPNKRASLFLNEELIKLSDGKPVWSPKYMTISELFRSQSQLIVADQIKLVCELYKHYAEKTGTTESLDDFYGWGELMLSDFDDLDKNMGDAEHIFENTDEIHSYDSADYLSEDQKEALVFEVADLQQMTDPMDFIEKTIDRYPGLPDVATLRTLFDEVRAEMDLLAEARAKKGGKKGVETTAHGE